MKILISGGYAPSLINFRGQLLRDLRAAGHEVVTCAADTTPAVADVLSSMGVRHIPVSVARTGLNPFADLRYLVALCRLIRTEAPTVVLSYTHKPITYTTIAARVSAPHSRRYGMVEGLGYVFIASRLALRQRIARIVLQTLYRISSRYLTGLFFLNHDDPEVFRSRRLIPRGVAQWIVSGAGVDIAHHAPAPLPTGPPRFLLIGRLLGDKGIREYAQAAALVRRRHPQAKFLLVGPKDSNPAAIRTSELETWIKSGDIVYHGGTEDVRPFLRDCFAYVLPSYREGMPRTVLEAMATGRPVITTDAPGCRETIFHSKDQPVATSDENVIGVNGVMVPVRSVGGLARAMCWLVENKHRAAEMGIEGRRLAETHFEAHAVSRQLCEAMQLV
jgi:glycosyltransferase involved in cell wall biosynthesis